MIPEREIWQAACALVKQYGEGAPLHAALRVDALIAVGELGGAAVWKEVLRAVEELLSTTPTGPVN